MDILEKIKPTEVEQKKLDKVVDKIIKKLNDRLIAAHAIPGGSYAKDTWLKDNHDIDIFVLFHKKYEESKISEVLLRVLKKCFLRVKKIQGSRAYYQIKKDGYIFEIIPVIEIENPEEALNIMDISPLHVNWVNHNAKNLKDDIRKAKAFCKSCYCYGAESYIRGFSGYVLEILISYYGSFDNLLRSAVKWEENEIIDFKKRNIKITNKSKLSPLVVIDPIQKERNAAAALSLEKFNRFKKYAEEYLKKPDNIFFISRIEIPEEACVIEAKPVEDREDISGTKLLKVYEFLKDKLDEEFKVKNSFWHWDKKDRAIFWYVLEKDELSPYKKHYGPKADDEINIKRFKHKWKGYETGIENDHVYVNLAREHTTLKPFLKEMLKDDYVKEKVRSIKILKFLNRKIYK